MKSFSHKRPVRNATGEIIDNKPAPVFRVTRDTLGGGFGPDRNRRLVVGLLDGDVIVMRPEKTRQVVSGTAADLYRYLLRCKANKAALEKANKAKAKKAAQREARIIAAADRKLRREIRSGK